MHQLPDRAAAGTQCPSRCVPIIPAPGLLPAPPHGLRAWGFDGCRNTSRSAHGEWKSRSVATRCLHAPPTLTSARLEYRLQSHNPGRALQLSIAGALATLREKMEPPTRTSSSRRGWNPPAAFSSRQPTKRFRFAQPTTPPNALRSPTRYVHSDTPAAARLRPGGYEQRLPSPPGARSICSGRNSLFDFTGIAALLDERGAGVVFRIAHDRNSPAKFTHECAFGNGGFGVVGAFGLNVRAQLANNRADVLFWKDDNCIHILQRRQDLGSLALGRHRPPCTFQRARGIVRVQRYHDSAAQFLRATQIADMTDVQQVEAAVGQNDLLPARAPLLRKLRQLS